MSRSLNYEDFSLRLLSDGRGGFLVRVESAPYLSAKEAPLELPYSLAETDSLLRTLETQARNSGPSPLDTPAAARDLVRHSDSGAASEVNPQDLGRTLFRTLFPPEVRESFLQSLGWAESRQNQALRLRVAFDPSCPELAMAHSLPWELLYRAETRDFLSRDVMTPLVRHLDAPRLQVRDLPSSPLRILAVVSSPRGVPYLDLEEERRRVAAAWGGRVDVRVEFLKVPTISEVRRALRDEAFHVFHFMGHGSFDAQSGQGVLLFEDPCGEQHAVSGQVLAETLKGNRALRLVFLNACETAQLPRRSGQDPYTGAASALVMGGVPAVVAMQFSISDAAAITFSDGFYSALAAGDLAETAMTEGRLAVYRETPASWEWITPVLFMGMEEGRILNPFPLNASRSRNMSTFKPIINNSESVIFGESVHVEGGVHINKAPSPAEEANRYRELGAESLDLGDYAEATRGYKAAVERTSAGDTDYYALALAALGRRRPSKLTRPEIREIEDHLERALKLRRRPHYLLFWAFLKYDYFVLNGMRVSDPTPEVLLGDAVAGDPDSAEVRRLLEHLPLANNNPIFRKIAELG